MPTITHVIIWTMQGNIKCFEHVPGEMTRFNIEQQDWTLKVWSNWKESVWARAVGYKYTKKGRHGLQPSNDLLQRDGPTRLLLSSMPKKIKNPSAAIHTSIQNGGQHPRRSPSPTSRGQKWDA